METISLSYQPPSPHKLVAFAYLYLHKKILYPITYGSEAAKEKVEKVVHLGTKPAGETCEIE